MNTKSDTNKPETWPFGFVFGIELSLWELQTLFRMYKERKKFKKKREKEEEKEQKKNKCA